MLRTFKADLHVHTCLSPCGDLKMSPKAIAKKAKEMSIDILGVCDHNSAENVPAVMEAAADYEISILPGLEVTSSEEIHILALFDSVWAALRLQDVIYAHLPGENDEETFGMQVVVNKNDEVLHFNTRLLIGASTLSVDDLLNHIHALEGIAVASHIDRESFSLLGQLGFIPADIALDGLEVSSKLSYEQALTQYDVRFPIVQSSDAHHPDDIGRSVTHFYLEEGTAAEIRKAFLNLEGRMVIH